MAEKSAAQTTKVRVLVLNSNSSTEMTHGIEDALRNMDLPENQSLELTTCTAPNNSPASINNGDDLEKSTAVVLGAFDLNHAVRSYDAILVACFSVHPLVEELGELLEHKVIVTGIFESSILAALSLLPPYAVRNQPPKTWGIVTTGKFWEAHLADGVRSFLGQDHDTTSLKFAGVYSTGLDAGDFHGGVSPKVIREKLKLATKKLLAGSVVACVVMGCAGMAGLEAIIREAAREQYGSEVAKRICVIDGVKAGVGLLGQAVRNARMFRE